MPRGMGRLLAMPVLDDAKRSFLETQVCRHRNVRSMVNRCRMVLRNADGLGNKTVAAELGVHEHMVGKWRRRFVKDLLDGLSDQPRSGPPRTPADRRIAEVIERTLTTTPGRRPIGRCALNPPPTDAADRAVARDHPAHLGRVQTAAAPRRSSSPATRTSWTR